MKVKAMKNEVVKALARMVVTIAVVVFLIEVVFK
jgi:hypothetical protein